MTYQANFTSDNSDSPYFQLPFPQKKEKELTIGSQQNPSKMSAKEARNFLFNRQRGRGPRPQPYSLDFNPDYLITQLDNSIINSPYLPFNGNEGVVNTPVLNGMIKLGASDLFKDYIFIGGFRLMSNLSGAEYFISYSDVSKRLDKTLTLFRRAEKQGQLDEVNRISSNEARYRLSWPFSEVTTLRGAAFVRLDKVVPLSTNDAQLSAPRR